MALPSNGFTYSLLPTITATTAASRKGATNISAPPGLLPLLNTSLATGPIKPKAAAVDPKLGAGNAVVVNGQTLFQSNYYNTKPTTNATPSTITFSPTLSNVVGTTATSGPAISTIKLTDKFAAANKDTTTQPANLNDYTFNLSPHLWSLPLEARTVDNRSFARKNGSSGATKSNVVGTNTNSAAGAKSKLRRGRITWHASAQDLQYTTGSGGAAGVAGGKARQMGFQFLWNPDSFSTQAILNADVTPSMQDRFVGVAGAFPGTGSIAINIRIDRTNDFACFAHKGVRERDPKSKTGGDRDKQWNAGFGKFYKPHKLGVATDAMMEKQIAELYQYGTLADIEFLYQTINGPNANYMKGGWKNSLGRVTSDIGFLSATLVKIEIGPLNYLGYVNAIAVNHLAFTQDMKPIRTDVSIQANLLASVGLAEAGK
jgi:hypothetical protein